MKRELKVVAVGLLMIVVASLESHEKRIERRWVCLLY